MINRTCWFRKYPSNKWKVGTLLAWSLDSDEDSGNIFPIAIVEEDKTGKVHCIYAENISFASTQE